ncbi:MAG TPA: hypothetical protein VMM78_10240 [Thermomicrobiales bacterium]|nr:hypothetical protein [Thermomicrobiales bacterium]
MTRIPIKRVTWAIPVLALFGATASRSYIQIDPDTVTVRFGWYRIVIPREHIASADVDTWPWFGGYGWRTDFRRKLGLIGALDPIVRIHLAEPRRARLLGIPIRYQELYVSVDSPGALLAALSG